MRPTWETKTTTLLGLVPVDRMWQMMEVILVYLSSVIVYSFGLGNLSLVT